MDFSDPSADDGFRSEVRRFLSEYFSADLEAALYETGDSHDQDFAAAMAERNWIAPEWEREGILPLGHSSREALAEELTRADAPTYLLLTSMMVARVIRRLGSEELRTAIIPEVAAGRLTIALGMSEPEAGSDVAAVQTRARRSADHWVIDGQKMFTTNGHVADFVFLLARTDPASERHRGLTTFLVPTNTPGVDVQGVRTISGERTNITYYSNVVLEDRWRIGAEGQGWQSLMVALQDEHSTPFSPHLARLLERSEHWAHDSTRGRPPIEQEQVAARLSRTATDLEVAGLLEVRASWMESIGLVPVAEGPMCKLFGTEAIVRRSEDIAAMVGPDSVRSRGDATSPEGGVIEHSLRYGLGMTIYAGSSEVQRNIIAQQRCGLPKSF